MTDGGRRPTTGRTAAALAAIAAVLAMATSLPAQSQQATQSASDAGGGGSAPGAELLADRAMLARLTQGTMAKFRFADAAQPLPEIAFKGADGAQRALSAWRGRFVLLNVWASWCAPCREEMPSLRRLAGALGADAPQVVLLSIDKSSQAATDFLREIGVTELASFHDPELQVSKLIGVRGAPTTVLIDPQGREIGRIEGAAHWDAEEALLLVKAMVSRWR